jgi:hypothetical protein
MRYRTSATLAALLLWGMASIGSAQPGFGPPEGRGGPGRPPEGRGGPLDGRGGPPEGREGRGGPPEERHGPGADILRINPVFAALDADKNGELSEQEIGNAVSVLKGLDKNGDGLVTVDELRPEDGPGGPQHGPGAPRGVGREAGRMGDRGPLRGGPTEAGRGEDHRGPDRPGDRGPGDRGPGDRGPGDRGPGDRGPGDRGPGDRGPGRGADSEERPEAGPLHPERFLELAFEFDENHDDLLSKDELKKMLRDIGPVFGKQGAGRPEGRGPRTGDEPRAGRGGERNERPELDRERDREGDGRREKLDK